MVKPREGGAAGRGPVLLAGAALRIAHAVLTLLQLAALWLADDERATADVHGPVKLFFVCQKNSPGCDWIGPPNASLRPILHYPET